MALPRSPSAISTTTAIWISPSQTVGRIEQVRDHAGRRSGRFASPYSFSVDGDSYSVVAADLDLDGHSRPCSRVHQLSLCEHSPGFGRRLLQPAFGSPVSLSGIARNSPSPTSTATGAQTSSWRPVDDRSKSTAHFGPSGWLVHRVTAAAQTSATAKAAHAMSFRSPRKLLRRSRLVHRQRLVRSGIVHGCPCDLRGTRRMPSGGNVRSRLRLPTCSRRMALPATTPTYARGSTHAKPGRAPAPNP